MFCIDCKNNGGYGYSPRGYPANHSHCFSFTFLFCHFVNDGLSLLFFFIIVSCLRTIWMSMGGEINETIFLYVAKMPFMKLSTNVSSRRSGTSSFWLYQTWYIWYFHQFGRLSRCFPRFWFSDWSHASVVGFPKVILAGASLVWQIFLAAYLVLWHCWRRNW